MVIERNLSGHLLEVTGRYPVVTMTGPRQSGKTTLCRMAFPDRPYVSLENPSERAFAVDDPVGFLARFVNGAVLDEVQRAPDLLSFLQGMVDEDPRPGRFILTGSQNLALMSGVSQSLAGRTALLELLPVELEELCRFPGAPEDLETVLWRGGYPRIHDRRLPADEWLSDYVATYVERDVRQLLRIGDQLQFRTFLQLCAGRVGQLLNLSALATECGISQPTARSWLSVLEASYIVFRLAPLHANFGKRLVKTPKLYFYDSGLAASLLGIEEPEQLLTHPLRGALFETFVVSEILKQHRHCGRMPRMYFYQERGRLEVDLVLDRSSRLTAVEIKAGKTPSTGFFSGLVQFSARLSSDGDSRWTIADRMVVYAGAESQHRSKGRLVSWRDLAHEQWTE
jgi:predicted AAA+ superfamily ATPase